MSGTPVSYPTTIADRAAGLNWSGYMQRWAARTATIAGFDYTGLGTQRRLYVPLATASLAGAMTPAQFTKLAGLQIPVIRLGYAAATDVLNGVALVAATWTDVHANQSFTVTSTTSLFLVELRLAVLFVLPATDTQVSSRLLFDSAGAPIAAEAGGGVGKASTYAHAGGGFFLVQGLAAGTHTVKAQVIAQTAATAYCRAAANPSYEWAKITIFELTP